MKHFRIECGVSQAAEADAIAMGVQGPGKNVKLRIEHISKSMLGTVPDLLADLLEIAAYIYCADQRLKRGSDKLTDYGSAWRRHLDFAIPVRCLSVWQRQDVLESLSSTLGFLSDDSYNFEFIQATSPPRTETAYFHNLIDASMEHEEVALFSGGVDSLAGALRDIVLDRKAVTLVGHHSATKVRNIQSRLVDEMKMRGYGAQLSFIPVEVTNEGVSASDYTQRARSFLFACLGFVIARMSHRDRFTFYENGVVSINLPIAGDVVGGRATRTTHPRALRGMERLFSILLDREFVIRTPLQWLTKVETTEIIRSAGFPELLAMTSSCTRPMTWTATRKHCGQCSQCIDRRFAVLAAGLEDFDPAENYGHDLLLSDRSADGSLRMAVSYVSFFQKVAATPRQRFLVEFPEIASAVDQLPSLSATQALDSFYDLLQRQSKAVEGVITAALPKHAEALYRGELPSASLLAACFSRKSAEPEVPSDYAQQAKEFMDRLAAPVLEFAVDDKSKRILFRGELALEGANFRLVNVLLPAFRTAKMEGAAVPLLAAPALARKFGTDEQSMRQQLWRLRKVIEPLTVTLGIPLDQDAFVENRQGGYRLNPAVIEISLSDIKQDRPPLSR